MSLLRESHSRKKDDEISIGDYVMSSGELAATVIVDSVYRLVENVITPESLDEESYSDGLLEYPQYTHPAVYKDLAVPEVLTGGNHELIRKWRLKKRLQKTLANRPDLISSARAQGLLTTEAEKMIEELLEMHLQKHEGRKRRGKKPAVN